jgi:hypothetical protein
MKEVVKRLYIADCEEPSSTEIGNEVSWELVHPQLEIEG